jgi:hypothetical protein
LTSLSLLLLYAVGVAAAAGIAASVGRRVPWRELLFFVVLPLLFAFPGFFQGGTILPVDHARAIVPWEAGRSAIVRYNENLNDAITQFAPWAKAVRMAWKEGSLPLRDRWNGCGTPLAANGQSAAFAPWTFLLFAVPLAPGFNVLVAWKIFFALCGTWLWLRELHVRTVAALFGAVAFALSFSMSPWLLFPQTSVLMLFPWILFAIERLRDPTSSGRAFAALTLLLAVWPLAGHVETVASFSLLGGSCLAFRALWGDFPKDRRVWRALVSSALVAGGLSAFALLPQALAIQASQRFASVRHPFWAALFSWKPHGPLWPGAWLTLFPGSLGDAIRSPMLPDAPASPSELGLAHVGVIGAACILLVFRPGSPRRPAGRALLALLAFGLLAGTAMWPFFEMTTLIPGLRMMFPLRWLSWAAFAGAALAALELDRLAADLARNRRSAIALLFATAFLALLAWIWFARHREAYIATDALDAHRRALRLALAALGAGAIASAAAWRSRLAARALPLALLLALTAELFWQGRRLYRFGSPADLYPETPLVAFLHRQPGPFRVVGEGSALFPSSNVFAGLEDIRTHDPVERADYVQFLDRCCGYAPGDYFKQLRDVNAPALDYLNVRYLVAAPGRPRPGARWRPVYSGADGSVFENTEARPPVFPAEGAGPAVLEYTERTNRALVRFRGASSRPAPFQTSLVDDGGWSVRSGSGRLLEKTRRYPPFLSFDLPPGETEARLAYSPPGFLPGSAISLSALSAVLAFAIHRWRRGARARELHSPMT